MIQGQPPSRSRAAGALSALALFFATLSVAFAAPVGALRAQSELPAPSGLRSSVMKADADDEATASHDGNIDLSWTVDEALAAAAAAGELAFTVEEHSDGGTFLLPAGVFTRAALSGRDDGVYRYRVRIEPADGEPGPWSAPIEVRVAHHPLWLASTFFLIGGVVFVATAALILLGHRRSRTVEHLPA